MRSFGTDADPELAELRTRFPRWHLHSGERHVWATRHGGLASLTGHELSAGCKATVVAATATELAVKLEAEVSRLTRQVPPSEAEDLAS